MNQTFAKTQTIPIGVVLRRAPGVTRWAKWAWSARAVLPGAGAANWQILREEDGATEYHAATLPLELHWTQTEAYLNGLSSEVPSIYVILRDAGHEEERPLEPLLVTASPYEAQDYADSGEELVEKVPMPHGLVAWVRDFALAHHQDEVFVKRRRDKKRTDVVEEGIGDPRIRQVADVYRAPAKRRRLQ